MARIITSLFSLSPTVARVHVDFAVSKIGLWLQVALVSMATFGLICYWFSEAKQ